MPSLDSVCFADELERWRLCKMPGGDETKTVEVGVWKETPPLPSDVRNLAAGYGPGKYRLLSYKAKSRPGPTSTFHIREDEEKASPVYDERATTQALVAMSNTVMKQCQSWENLCRDQMRLVGKLMAEQAGYREELAGAQQGWTQALDSVMEAIQENPQLLYAAGQGIGKLTQGAASLLAKKHDVTAEESD